MDILYLKEIAKNSYELRQMNNMNDRIKKNAILIKNDAIQYSNGCQLTCNMQSCIIQSKISLLFLFLLYKSIVSE